MDKFGHTFDKKNQTKDIFAVPELSFKGNSQLKWLPTTDNELWVNRPLAEEVLVRSVASRIALYLVVDAAHNKVAGT